MSLELAGFIIAVMIQTAFLVRWGTRMQGMVERHHESLYDKEIGLHAWRHHQVNPRLNALDDLLAQLEERRQLKRGENDG